MGVSKKGLIYIVFGSRDTSIPSFECENSLLQTFSLEPHVIQGDKNQTLVLIYNPTVTNCDNLK